MRLYLLPYAGGSAKSYQVLQPFFAPTIDVVPLDVPDRGRMYADLPELLSLREMAHRIAVHIGNETEPYAIFGHSMGALLAFEVVRALTSMHGCLPLLLMVSGHQAPHLERTCPSLHDSPQDEFDRRLSLLSATPQEILDHGEMMDLLRPRIRRDFQACETYRYTEGRALPVPLACLGGDDDPTVSIDELHAWSMHSSDYLGSFLFPGGHFYFLDNLPEVAKEVERLMCLVAMTA
ncbi:thioesterase II family protein [Vibrio spartinae]|uniref:Linear gramicidin dehydrogenase LgrE n=1 Tax=Vibrio spartinae TaxID=1918945 RepID=A0A1N6M7F8_9VIBR|nr:alpha/beta fold hydrolase [Vibrio spartinae]QMV14118.1 Linear gramicidin dehydrogenase LgrE [Vibrio spartinae]SIO95383.1 Linear gramicidin dehydrogenase LgrE [Vibrio spartinae]